MLTNFILGQTALSPEDPGFLLQMFDAIANKQWWAVVAGVFALSTFIAQKYLSDKFPFLKSTLAVALFGTALAFLLGVANALAGGGAFTGAIALAAIKIAFTSAYGKKFVEWLIAKVVGLFGTKADPEQLKAEAAEAGKSAGASVTPLNSKDLVNKE